MSSLLILSQSWKRGAIARVDWRTFGLMLGVSLFVACSRVCFAAPPLDFESPPVRYSEANPDNAVSRLQAAVDNGETELPFEDQFGYLRGVLKHLDVPESSQMLTFLKTSMQRPLIGPRNARALYFGDDAYVGYVPGGVLELIVADEELGMVFYTLEQDPTAPKFQRQVSRCMTCHSSSRTKNIPGLQVRSMMTDPQGAPVLSAGSFRTNHGSPLKQRWGGWFVSGTHGETRHLGNFQLPSKKRPKQPIDNTAGANVTDLSSLTDLNKQLTPHSDLVALMVFEHQIDAHNLMVRTNYAWRIDLHHGRQATPNGTWKQEANALVDHLLFKKALRFQQPVQGTSSFTSDFSHGRTRHGDANPLRELDLSTRLFRSPVSYTVQSTLFRALPLAVRRYIGERIEQTLSAKPRHSDEATERQAWLDRLPDLLMIDEMGASGE